MLGKAILVRYSLDRERTHMPLMLQLRGFAVKMPDSKSGRRTVGWCPFG